MIVWLTGLPCSGKTTLGLRIVDMLVQAGYKAELLDGDEVRRKFWPELGFSAADRRKNVARLGLMAQTISHYGVAVVSAVSPYRVARDLVRAEAEFQEERFIEVYVNAPLHVCEKRDVKGMYAKARTGEIPVFTGVSDPYQPPLSPDVECLTETETIEESLQKVLFTVEREIAVEFGEQAVEKAVEKDICFTGAGDGV